MLLLFEIGERSDSRAVIEAWIGLYIFRVERMSVDPTVFYLPNPDAQCCAAENMVVSSSSLFCIISMT